MSQAAGSGPNYVLQGIPPGDQELHREFRLKQAEDFWATESRYNQAATNFGQQAIRGAFVANGAAIVAILALLGSLHAKQTEFATSVAHEMFLPGACFAFGLVAALLANGVAYFNFSFLAASMAKSDEIRGYTLYNQPMPSWGRKPFPLLIGGSAWTAVILVLLSIGAFVAGANFAGRAITGASPPHAQTTDQCRAVLSMDGKHYHLLFCPLDDAKPEFVGGGSTKGP